MQVLCGPIFGGAQVAGWAASRSVSLMFSPAQKPLRRDPSANARCHPSRPLAALSVSRKWGATLANSNVKFEPAGVRFARARGCRVLAAGLWCAILLLCVL